MCTLSFVFKIMLPLSLEPFSPYCRHRVLQFLVLFLCCQDPKLLLHSHSYSAVSPVSVIMAQSFYYFRLRLFQAASEPQMGI